MPKIKTDHKKWLEVMEEMLTNKKYDFAWDRIELLRDWVLDNKRIEGKHIGALQNLQKKAGDL